VPLTSSGTGAARGRGPRGIGIPCPTASTGGPSASPAPSNSEAGLSRAARIARREFPIAVRESDGAAISTRWPRSDSFADTRSMKSLTSWNGPHGCGVTWAIERRSTRAA
jgi:hypothetical protein